MTIGEQQLLHYNELAQRSLCFWRHLTFVDTRWYTLKFVSSTVNGRFQFVEGHSRTLLFAQCIEDFCACALFRRTPTNWSYAEGAFTERNANGLCVGSVPQR